MSKEEIVVKFRKKRAGDLRVMAEAIDKLFGSNAGVKKV